MKKLFLFFILVFFAQLSLGFDCSYFSGINHDNCLALKDLDEDLIAGLLYQDSLYPKHSIISSYNKNIEVNSAPAGMNTHYKGVIEGAWLDILTVQPSVVYKGKFYVPDEVTARSQYGYSIDLPDNYYSSDKDPGDTCKVRYYLDNKQARLKYYVNGKTAGTGRRAKLSLKDDSVIKARLVIKATVKKKYYEWDRYCCRYRDGHCRLHCYDCDYDYTDYDTTRLVLTDSKEVNLYEHEPEAGFSITDTYYGTSKGIINADNRTAAILKTTNSYFETYPYEYSAYFIKKPYYFLQLEATDESSQEFRNLIKDNNTLYIKNTSQCHVSSYDFFSDEESSCSYDLQNSSQPIEAREFSGSWWLLIKIITFLVICYFIYQGIKKYWGKALVPVAVFLLLIPVSCAGDCGLTNLASCLPEKMYDFIIKILNSPIKPLLDLTKNMLKSSPSIDLFKGVWKIMVYCISMFYGLLFIYSGYMFLFSGHNVIRREMAKEWLKNTVIMIVLVQASFYLYGLVVELGTVLTTSVLSMVDEHFFMITADNIVNIGLEFFFVLLYVLTLLITVILLVIRYLIVAMGVIFCPIGIFCYFIPPLKSYGRLIINVLGMCIFITFLDAIVILACSMLIEVEIFESFKILVMICCFGIINMLFFILIKHIINKSSLADSGEKVAQAVKYVAMFA